MHVDAFFDYLLGNPHPYWTEIPMDPNPVKDGGRDGVAAEDDMALRSLLPHIKPRRGRKRPDDERLSRSPSQRPRLSSDHLDTVGVFGAEGSATWTGMPDHRGGGNVYSWTRDDFNQTPTSAHSLTANTSTTASASWPAQGEELLSTETSHKPKTNKRHGAKVVSSAWRSGGPGGSGKTRGRPPAKRQESTASLTSRDVTPTRSASSNLVPGKSPGLATSSTLPQQQQHHDLSTHMIDTSLANSTVSIGAPLTGLPMDSAPHQDLTARQQGHYDFLSYSSTQVQTGHLNTNRIELSLQVPERIGADVRLATPQDYQVAPMIMVNNTFTNAGNPTSNLPHHQSQVTTDMQMSGPAAQSNIYDAHFQQGRHTQDQYPHQPRVNVSSVPQNSAAFTSTIPTMTQMARSSQEQSAVPHALFHQPSQAGTTAERSPPSTNAQATMSHLPSADLGREARQPTEPPNRTNVDALESLLTYELMGAEWRDARGYEAPVADLGEATVLARRIIASARRQARTAQAYLMNLAALAGTTWLRPQGQERTTVFRLSEDAPRQAESSSQGGWSGTYEIHWRMQLGEVRGGFSLRQEVSEGGISRSRNTAQRDAEGEDDDGIARGERMDAGLDAGTERS